MAFKINSISELQAMSGTLQTIKSALDATSSKATGALDNLKGIISGSNVETNLDKLSTSIDEKVNEVNTLIMDISNFITTQSTTYETNETSAQTNLDSIQSQLDSLNFEVK